MNKTLIGILSVLVVLLVACAPAQEQKAEPEAKPVEKGEVVFGWLGPLTGGAATIGVPVKDAVELAVLEINANNVIPGKTLKMIYEDDSCDPKKSTTSTQKFVDVDKVAAIVGGLCSGTVLADAPIVEGKVLMMSFSATNPKIKDAGDYIFRNVPSDNGQGTAAANLMQKLGYKKVGIIHIQNDYAVGLTDVFKGEAKKLGFEIVATETYNPDDTDFKTQIAKIKAKRPDALYMVSHPADAAIVLKQISELGFKVPIVGADASKDDAVISGAGKAAEGLIVTLPGVPKSPELEKFASAYKAKTGKEFSAYTPEAYDVVYILAKACAATDCTSTAMKDYLYGMGKYTGASGTYEFDKDGEVDKPYDYFVVKDGKWEAYVAS